MLETSSYHEAPEFNLDIARDIHEQIINNNSQKLFPITAHIDKTGHEVHSIIYGHQDHPDATESEMSFLYLSAADLNLWWTHGTKQAVENALFKSQNKKQSA